MVQKEVLELKRRFIVSSFTSKFSSYKRLERTVINEKMVSI